VLRDVGQLVADAVRPTVGDVGVTVHPVSWDHGRPAAVSPPDAVVEIDGYRVGTWGGREFFCPTVLHDNHEGHTGTHSPEGVFLGLGRGMQHRAERGVNYAIDLTPTIMDLLELDPKSRFPGRSLKEI
jgi:predicted AlkP superfamily phosphohydrolase/phosphomutase